MQTGFRFLGELTQNINVLVKTLQTEEEVNGEQNRYLARLPIVDTDNEELFGSYEGQVFAADIIVDDQEAVIHEAGGFQAYSGKGMMPKIKHGARVGESMIRRLNALSQQISFADGDSDLITGMENRLADRLVRGIRMRQNALAANMFLDLVAYDKLGVKIETSSTWGMPTELKRVAGTPWATSVANFIAGVADDTAKPITDIRKTLQAGRAAGTVYNRVTMASTTFALIPQTTEFLDMAKFLYKFDIPSNTLDISNVDLMINLTEQMIGARIEIDDTVYRERNTKNQNVMTRNLPAEYLLFSNSADDGNDNVFDYSNGTVIESVVAPLGNAAIREAFGGAEQRGPFAFYNVPQDLNPPALVCWAVQVGWPRKHAPEATARLRVL
jgi:hypothetical protein